MLPGGRLGDVQGNEGFAGKFGDFAAQTGRITIGFEGIQYIVQQCSSAAVIRFSRGVSVSFNVVAYSTGPFPKWLIPPNAPKMPLGKKLWQLLQIFQRQRN